MSFLTRWLQAEREGRYRRAIELYNDRQFEAAVAAFAEVLSGSAHRDPRASLARFYLAEAHCELGWFAIEAGDLRRARDEFLAALGAGYRYPDLHLRLGRVHEALGESEAAETAYTAALAIHDGLLEARAHRARLRLARGFPLGDDLFLLAAGGWTLSAGWKGLSDPEAAGNADFDPLRRAVAGALTAELERREQVADQVRAALDAFESQDGETALGLLQAAALLRPEYPDLHFRIGVLHARAGRNEAAERALCEALERKPEYEEAQRWLLRVRSARAA